VTVADHTLLMTCHWWLTPVSWSPQALPPSRTCSAATHLDTCISAVWSSRHSCEAYSTRQKHWKNLHISISKQHGPCSLGLHLIPCNLHSPVVHTALCLPHPNTADTDAAQKSCERHNAKYSQTCKVVGNFSAWHLLQSHQVGACLGTCILGNMCLRSNLSMKQGHADLEFLYWPMAPWRWRAMTTSSTEIGSSSSIPSS